jgi:uncharacterized protein
MMLTADLVKPRLRKRGGQLTVDLLPTGQPELRIAADLITLFQRYVGKTQEAWQAGLEVYEGARTDYIILRGLAKVLEDSATFTPRETIVDPAELRRQLFAQGPVFGQADLFHLQDRVQTLQASADAFGVTMEQIEIALFADRPAEYLLVDAGPAWTPDGLIARYNLELARGVLYWSDRMQIDIFDGYKDFWRYMKFFKLMFEAIPLAEGGYHVALDGPISPFVKATTRYGRQFAAFLPALLLDADDRRNAGLSP